MRIFARRERPHPGAQLTLFEAEDGWRYSLWVTNRPAATKGWLGQNACLDAAHRVQARVEDAIRTGKDTELGHFPSFDFKVNTAWLTAAMIACILLAWLKLLALDDDLAKAEPKTMRSRPARRGPAGTRRPAAAPENPGNLALGRGNHRGLAAHRRAPRKHTDQHEPVPATRKGQPGARGTPGHPARQPGHRNTPALKSGSRTRSRDHPAPAINPDERSGLVTTMVPIPHQHAAFQEATGYFRQALCSLMGQSPRWS
jgi:hypothetical protein